MGTFKDLVENLVKPLLAYPEDYSCEETEEDGFKVLNVTVREADLGRVVGKSGHIAKAIRTILYAKASKEGIKVRLNILSK